MPAPAVIPALIAYVKVVAVKTLVVGTRSRGAYAEPDAVTPQGVRSGAAGIFSSSAKQAG